MGMSARPLFQKRFMVTLIDRPTCQIAKCLAACSKYVEAHLYLQVFFYWNGVFVTVLSCNLDSGDCFLLIAVYSGPSFLIFAELPEVLQLQTQHNISCFQ